MTSASTSIRPVDAQQENRAGRATWAAVVITAAAAALRFVHLGAHSLWLDEAISVAIARLGWSDFRKVITNHEANMALYYLLLKFWIHLGGSEFVIRSLSVVAAVATVWLVYRIGAEWFGRDTGLIASALLTINAFHMRYAQEARSYALVALLVTLSTWRFARFIAEPTPANRRWYVTTSVLALYTQFFALLVLAAQFASLLPARCPSDVSWRDIFKTYGIIALFFFPLAWFIAFKNSGQLGWLPPLSATEIYRLFFNLAGRSHALVVIYLVLLISAALAWRRLSLPDRWSMTVLGSWLFVPIALVLVASVFKPLLYPRFLIVCLPPLTLLGGFGLAHLRVRWGVLGLVIALSVPATPGLSVERFDPPDQDWRGLTNYIAQHAQPGDALIIFHPFGALDYDYYRARLHVSADAPQLLFPARADGVILYSVKPIDSRMLQPGSALRESLTASRGRVWLLDYRFTGATRDPALDSLESFLRTNYPSVVRRRFADGLEVYLYSR